MQSKPNLEKAERDNKDLNEQIAENTALGRVGAAR